MSTVSLTLNEILDLAKKTLLANGCDDETASILAELIMKAERDGSLSHGLFRLPAYVSGLKSGKINGKARPEVKKISPSVIKGGLDEVNINSDDMEVPVLGKIAAGTPVEAIQNEVSRIPLPSNLEKNGDYFGLKVQGDSMIEAGINEGDTVIIRRTDTADNGKIVVALIDEHEAMLKRIRKKGKVVALESANRNYETKIFGPDRVKVQGVLVSLYRNF